MKQKIFSLLVLMITTVSSAWALPAEPEPTYDVVLTMTNNSVTPVVYKFGGDNAAVISMTQSKSFSSNEILALVQEAYATTFPAENYTISLSNIVSVSSGSAFGSNADGITIGPFDNGTNGYLSEPISFEVSFIVEPKPGYIPTIGIDDSYSAPLRVDVYHNQHSFDGSEEDWRTNTTLATHHWHDCNNVYGGCKGGVESYLDKEEHVYDSDSDLPCVCTKCGHLNHILETTYTKTTDAHYYACTISGCPLSSSSLTADDLSSAETALIKFGAHVDENLADGYCDVCEYVMNAQVDPHQHDFNTAVVYGKNDNYHWKVCQAAGCDLDYAYIATWTALTANADTAAIVSWAEHNYTLENNTLCVCGAEKPAPVHEHSFSEDWTKLENVHYHKCTVDGCELKDDNLTEYKLYETYDYSEADVAALGDDFGYGLHSDNSQDGYCDVCTYHMHLFSEDWTQTETHHYHMCTVGGCELNADDLTEDDVENLTDHEKTGLAFAAHVYDQEENTKCVCGAIKPPHTHHVGSTWTLDADHPEYHYLPCDADGCDITDYSSLDDDGKALFHYEEHGVDYLNVCPKCFYHGQHQPHATDYVQKEGYHYKKCITPGCPYNSDNLTADDFSDADTAELFDFGQHADEDPEDNLCDKCNIDMSTHHHFFTNEWTTTETTHYHKCIAQGCDILQYSELVLELPQYADVKDAVAFGEHSFDTNNVCSECGYKKHIHHFADEWTKTAESHYHKCLIQGCNITDYSKNNEDLASDYGLTADEIAAIAYAGHDYTGSDPNVCTICGYDKAAAHVHVFGDDWYEMAVNGKKYHYKKCTADGCTIANYESMSNLEKALTSYGQHQYGTSQEGAAYYTCKVCGMVNEEREAEQHDHNYQWVSIATGTGATADDPEHWEECVATEGACFESQRVPDEKKHKFDAEATDDTYYTCSICGYIDEQRKADAPHVHVFAEAWSNNETHHYHECIGTQGECTLKYDGTDNEALEKYAEHTYGASQEGAKYYTCQTCGYINTTRKNAPHNHVYGGDDAWKHDNLQHWKECTAADNGDELAGPCTAPKGLLGNHEYASVDDAATTDKDERALCSVCKWYNEARKTAIDNAAEAANVQSWCWDYEIPFNFEATVQNDRRFNAEQCYTIFLPYALELNGLKAYTIEQHNDNIVGFKEQAVTELPQLTPFVVKSETTGNPLSSPMTTVYATLLSADQADWMTADEKAALISDRGYANSQASIHSTGGRLYMLGTLRYLVGNEANGRYIMQGKDVLHPNGVFKMISGTDEDNAGYDKVDNRACILPMRAHIETLGGDSREFLGVRLIKADGSVTTIDRLVLDPDDNTVYDLQGRRVQNPRKGGLYIIGGRKVMYK